MLATSAILALVVVGYRTYASARRIADKRMAIAPKGEVYLGTHLSWNTDSDQVPFHLNWCVTYSAEDKHSTIYQQVGLLDILNASGPQTGDPWQYDGEFHAAIRTANRIVVRNGGFDCCRSTDGDPVLFETTDPQEIAEVFRSLAFEKAQVVNSGCLCCGGPPGIDWFRGRHRIALTAYHDESLRWRGFHGSWHRSYGGRLTRHGEAKLTPESRARLGEWLARHATKGEKTANKAVEVSAHRLAEPHR